MEYCSNGKSQAATIKEFFSIFLLFNSFQFPKEGREEEKGLTNIYKHEHYCDDDHSSHMMNFRR